MSAASGYALALGTMLSRSCWLGAWMETARVDCRARRPMRRMALGTPTVLMVMWRAPAGVGVGGWGGVGEWGGVGGGGDGESGEVGRSDQPLLNLCISMSGMSSCCAAASPATEQSALPGWLAGWLPSLDAAVGTGPFATQRRCADSPMPISLFRIS